MAGAWVAPEAGQEIVTHVVSEDSQDLELFSEQPLTDTLALVGAARTGSLTEAEIGAKWVALQAGGHVAALQATAVWSIPDGDSWCSPSGHEVRGLYGLSSSDGALFLNVEGAVRRIAGCPAHRLDLTGGWRLGADWLALGQVFSHRERDGRTYSNVQLSAVWFDKVGHGLQLGVRVGADGQPPAVVVAVWNTPRR